MLNIPQNAIRTQYYIVYRVNMYYKFLIKKTHLGVLCILRFYCALGLKRRKS